MYYELAKMVKDVVDIDCDVTFEDGILGLDLKIKIPIAQEIENAYRNLTS